MTHVAFHLSRVMAPRALINQHYGAHQVFWRAYGLTPESQGQVQPFRFRETPGPQDRGAVVTYLVQSAQQPRWEQVFGLRAEVKTVQFAVEPGMRLFFRLRACIQRTIIENDRRRKVSIFDPQGIEEWLYRQGKAHGFVATEFVFSRPELTNHYTLIKGGQGQREFKLGDTQFDGRLQVNDPERLAAAIVNGVGPKAAFGFGMLSVSRH